MLVPVSILRRPKGRLASIGGGSAAVCSTSHSVDWEESRWGEQSRSQSARSMSRRRRFQDYWVGLSMVSLRQESLGKEEETRTWKPFVGTLRVRIPPGKAGPAARSESCVAVGRPTLRSVDSEVKGRVIEPRNYKPWGAFVLDTGGGRVRQVALGPTEPAWSYRGRRARTMTTRVLQEPERPRRFHRNPDGETGTDNSLAPGGTPRPRGAKHGRNGGIGS